MSVVEATPAQMARAVIGLATGRLPELRLVDAVRDGDTGAWHPLPRGEVRELPYSAGNLDFVRQAMRGVAADPAGSAYTTLAPEELGFEVAVKTGSADLAEYAADGRLIKHTWVMGWALDEVGEPVVGFVFFVRKTVETSSHSSTWLARQFFLRPEVRDFLRGRGVDVRRAARAVDE